MIRNPNDLSHVAPSSASRNINLNVEKSITSYDSWLTFAHQNNTASGIIIMKRSRANEPSQPRNSNSSYVFIVASGGACSCCRANQYRVLEKEQSKSGAMDCCSVQSIAQSMCGRRAVSGRARPQKNGRPRPVCSRAWRNTGSLAHIRFRRMESSHSFDCLTEFPIAVRDTFPVHSQLPGRVPTQKQDARVLCFCFPNSKRKAGRRDNPRPHAIELQQGLATPNTNSTDKISSRRHRDVGNVAKSERGPIGHRASHFLGHNFKGVSVTLIPATISGVGKSGPLIRCGEGGRVDTRAWACAGISQQRGIA